ncbi:hypothetical protein UE98_39520 [Burkholderia cenocepacia]|nr:hypothetical protein UE98_39520 [Burkholderia cenocepacia]
MRREGWSVQARAFCILYVETGCTLTVIASEAKQSIVATWGEVDCFVAVAPRNDERGHAKEQE